MTIIVDAELFVGLGFWGCWLQVDKISNRAAPLLTDEEYQQISFFLFYTRLFAFTAANFDREYMILLWRYNCFHCFFFVVASFSIRPNPSKKLASCIRYYVGKKNSSRTIEHLHVRLTIVRAGLQLQQPNVHNKCYSFKHSAVFVSSSY